jgi:hypothetical protein
MTQTIRTIADFGYAAGTADKRLAAQAAKWHAKYIKASEDAQGQMRVDYCHNYLVGKYGYKMASVEKIAAQTRDERGEADQRAWNNAQSNFNYRVVALMGTVKKASQTVEVKVPRALRAEIKALLETYTKAQIKAALKF